MIVDMEKVAWLAKEEIQQKSMELLGQWEAFSGRKPIDLMQLLKPLLRGPSQPVPLRSHF